MILAVSQPTYFPYCGYFDLINSVDCFCFYDDVKLEKSSWQVRNIIKTPTGELMITVPTYAPFGRLETVINDTMLVQDKWRDKHIRSIQINYSKAKYYNETMRYIKSLIEYSTNNLADLNMYIITMISRAIGIKTRLYKSSDLKSQGQKDDRLSKMVLELKCNSYLSGQSGSDYIEKNTPGGEFIKNGIALYYQNYICQEYPQLYGRWMEKLSIIDLLMNVGIENALEVIEKGNQGMISYRELPKYRGGL